MTRVYSLFALPLLAATLLHAEVPSSVLFQGYLTNNGAPLNGSQTLLVKACDAAVDGNCKTVFNDKVQASNGYYTALLQNLPTMDKQYWLEVVSNGSLLSERIALTATPFALRAAVADSSAKVGTATKAIFADSATGAVRSTSALTAGTASHATNASIADSAVKINSKAAVSSLAGLTGAIAVLSGTGVSMAANPVNQSITISATGKFDTVAATSYRYLRGQSKTLDIGGGSLGLSYTSTANWKVSDGHLYGGCISGGMGTLYSSVAVNLPDGAVVDSIALYASDEVGFPVNLALAYTAFDAPATTLLLGNSPKAISSGTLLLASYSIYKATWSTLTPAAVKNGDGVYKISLNSTNTASSCSNASVQIMKISIYYRTFSL